MGADFFDPSALLGRVISRFEGILQVFPLTVGRVKVGGLGVLK